MTATAPSDAAAASAPLILGVDTATRQATVAICRGGEVLAEGDRLVTTHSEGLLDLIHQTLVSAGCAAGQLDAVACGKGPGSFTGLRIGMATAKGICLAAGKPLICVSSLQPLAAVTVEALAEALVEALAETLARAPITGDHNGSPGGAPPLVAALLDARRAEIFCGLFSGEELLGPEIVCPPAEIHEHLPADRPLVLAGDGALAYEQILLERLGDGARLAPEGCHQIHARYLCEVASARLAAGEIDDLAAAAPRYIRPSDARLPSQPQTRRSEALARAAASTPAEPEPGPEPEPEDAADTAWIEEIRQSHLRLDREGRWWHEGQIVTHERLSAALHGWLDRHEDGRYILHVDEERFSYVEVEDAPYQVRTVELEGPSDAGSGHQVRVYLQLSDGSEEELDYESLRVGEFDALYCRVKGRFDARFSRHAYYLLGELVEQADDGFALRAAGELWPIQQR